jgi:heat shock protein HslJ
MVAASYTVDGSNLTIKPGASTRAHCGDASADAVYLSSLQKVASYAIEGDKLNLVFPDAAGQMHFDNGGSR